MKLIFLKIIKTRYKTLFFYLINFIKIQIFILWIFFQKKILFNILYFYFNQISLFINVFVLWIKFWIKTIILKFICEYNSNTYFPGNNLYINNEEKCFNNSYIFIIFLHNVSRETFIFSTVLVFFVNCKS